MEPVELIVATQNQGKMREIRGLLADQPVSLLSLADFPEAPDIVEDGESFAENAMKKAAEISHFTGGKLVMGEDSGLEVDALDGAPGIYSARFSGQDATDEKNNQKLIDELKDVEPEKRTARYQCYIALVKGDEVIAEVSGSCEGRIVLEARGTNGFGYDPYFLIPEYEKTFGELDPSIKAQISHRAKALRHLKEALQGFLQIPE